MTQVGLDEIWLQFLKDYVSPLQQRVFHGYYDYVSVELILFFTSNKHLESKSLAVNTYSNRCKFDTAIVWNLGHSFFVFLLVTFFKL